MIKIQPLFTFLGALGIVGLAGCAVPEEGSEPEPATAPVQRVLLTEAEAAELGWTEEEWQDIDRAFAPSNGPRIRFEKPTSRETDRGPLVETTTPTALRIVFERNRADVDMESLEVKAKRGISLDLTPRLEPYISKEEAALDAESLKVPAGKFKLVISIADVEGRLTRSTFRVRVKDS